MATMTVEQALEQVYTALHGNNQGLDSTIEQLAEALMAASAKQVTMKKERLPNNTRPGRKMLQTYFKKRGVVVEFDA